jgi:hypothetical protein
LRRRELRMQGGYGVRVLTQAQHSHHQKQRRTSSEIPIDP